MAIQRTRTAIMSPAERSTLVTTFGTLWAVYLVNSLLLSDWLLRFGVIPRSVFGLPGLVLAPFLHASLLHIVVNTFGGLPGALAVLRRGRREFWGVTIATALGSGLFTWIFGAANSVHVGFSGVLFGYAGYLLGLTLARGPYEPPARAPAVRSLLLALLISLLPGMSLSGHLGGLLTGFVLVLLRARAMRSRI